MTTLRPVSKHEIRIWLGDPTTKQFIEKIHKLKNEYSEALISGSTLKNLGSEVKDTAIIIGMIAALDELLVLNYVEELSDGEE